MYKGFGRQSLGMLARFVVLACLLTSIALFGLSARAADDFLEPEQAFRFSARMLDSDTAEVSYTIADGYYMYRERFAFKADGAEIGTPAIPPGKVKFDDTFQKDVETYRNHVVIRIPVKADGSFVLKATGQGCADKGLCYPPMETDAHLSTNVASRAPPFDHVGDVSPSGSGSADADMGKIEASLHSGRLLAILPLFLLLGLGLSLTPCVLPMLPILSSIIIGEGANVRRSRGFTLSAAYSFGMALVYTALGVTAGLVGEGMAAALQNPWALGAFAILMATLSLSMFGVYQLQVPAAIQARLAQASSQQASGKLFGVFIMGAISALIVGPCVAAPLAGALLYISQTRDVLIGGSALFAMAAGMSVPLLLLGLSAGTLLPRAGAWMESVKNFFGVLMLGLAVWIVSPVIPGWITMTSWGLLGLGYGAYLLGRKRWSWVSASAGTLFGIVGLVFFVGVATGGNDPLAPLSHFAAKPHRTEFIRIKSTNDLDAILANTAGKTVMLDFYADWCVSCKEMEKLTFSDSRVQAKFADMLLLQADVTANDEQDKALLKRFKLFGPPGIIFFDKSGREIPGGRVIGYQDADKFLGQLEKASGL